MLLKVFCVYDSKVAVHFQPFYVAHPELARRAFAATVADPNSSIHAAPADFTLLEIAEWDDEKGEFNMYPKPINHGLAATYQVRSSHGAQQQKPKRNGAPVQRDPEGGDPAQHV